MFFVKLIFLEIRLNKKCESKKISCKWVKMTRHLSYDFEIMNIFFRLMLYKGFCHNFYLISSSNKLL